MPVAQCSFADQNANAICISPFPVIVFPRIDKVKVAALKHDSAVNKHNCPTDGSFFACELVILNINMLTKMFEPMKSPLPKQP
jgi:hypothetical protein